MQTKKLAKLTQDDSELCKPRFYQNSKQDEITLKHRLASSRDVVMVPPYSSEMNFITTELKDLILIEPKVFSDSRGYFFESYSQRVFGQAGLTYNFVQDNESRSGYGTLRGLHFQTGEHAQAKLVRALEGEILDVAVDLRNDSPTYGKHFSTVLSSDNKRMMMIPRGFAHGFIVLSEHAVFSYKCDNFYAPGSEGGIHYADPQLNIDWRVPGDKILLSEKDRKNPRLNNI